MATRETLAPPTTSVDPLTWLRRNLFNSWYNAILTVLLSAALVWMAIWALDWALTDARWGVVTTNLRLFLMGQYPPEHTWRLWLALAGLSVLSGLSSAVYGGRAIRTLGNWLAAGQLMLAVLAAVSGLGPIFVAVLAFNAAVVWVSFFAALRRPLPRRWLGWAWLASIPVMFVLLHGLGAPDAALGTVRTGLWGGLLLTFVLAVVSIVLSFPFGVLLALGRRSSLPAMRVLSTIYIEVIRGVPLVTLLFMLSIMLPLFLPGEVRVDHVVRAMAALTLFSAAYVAENVRGGLQAIPSGQIEASKALGLSGYHMNRYIVLPQALRAVIPANVGLFISLLKDTTLVAIIGLLELLGIGRAVLAQTEWFGAQLEVYVFITAIFFVMCYTMSVASYRLEEALGVGKR